MPMEILELLNQAAADDASDLFLTAGKPPYRRQTGIVETVAAVAMEAAAIDAFRQQIVLPRAETAYQENGSCDAGLTVATGRRFRINFFRQQGVPGLVARPVPSGDHLAFAELHLPDTLAEFADATRGLILVVGATGSGKSTTMAAMLNHINTHHRRHIVTIEDPIEFVHRDNQSLITQREVGSDTVGFAEALRNVVRESPDVIIIGEMRDLDTMQTAVTAALTGHLVISTLHTSDTIQALERVINYFPEHLRQQAAEDLALALVGVTGQRLVPAAGGGRIPAVEILRGTPHVRNLLAARNFPDLDEAIRRGQEDGMITFNRYLADLCRAGAIELEAGANAATNRDEYLLLVQGMESGIDTFREYSRTVTASDDELDMKRLLYSAVANAASDLVLTTGSPPVVRVHGDLAGLNVPALTPADTKRLLFSILAPRQRAEFESSRELDFALTIAISDSQGVTRQYRFRVNGFYQRGNIGVAIRVIPSRIPSPEELKLPPALVKLVDRQSGLLLVTGPTGHGKSTTLAALVDRINATRACHIITIEDPIEYVHQNHRAVVEQREVHADTLGFNNALKYVLRQNPDVILIGEMRDPETIAAALTAAETGHLVLATLHTNSAPLSVDRIVDSFPSHQQNQIRIQLSGALLGIVAQRLIPHQDGTRRVAAFELMIGTPAILSLIREGKTQQLQSIIETSFKDGMITMDRSLNELYAQGQISREAVQSLSKIMSHSLN